MKVKRLNFSKATAGFLITALLVLSACDPHEPVMIDQEVEEVNPPQEIISLDEAKELCENYENQHILNILKFEMAENGSEEKFMPIQFVAFKLETLKSYIKYVERQAGKAKVDPDSLRIYFGNYGKEGRNPNKNTVFILPTAKIANDYGGFYIGADGQAKLIRNYWPKAENGGQEGEPKSKASFMSNFPTSLMQGGRSLIMNRGSSGPPPFGDF